VKYDLAISAEEEKVLRDWHAQDPVDSQEEERHDKIASIQLTRNPFVDYPEMVDEIKDF
jgi:endonuclease I